MCNKGWLINHSAPSKIYWYAQYCDRNRVIGQFMSSNHISHFQSLHKAATGVDRYMKFIKNRKFFCALHFKRLNIQSEQDRNRPKGWHVQDSPYDWTTTWGLHWIPLHSFTEFSILFQPMNKNFTKFIQNCKKRYFTTPQPYYTWSLMSKHPFFMDSLCRYGWPKTLFQTWNNGPVS